MNGYILFEAFIFGIITLIIGTIVFNLTINKKNKEDKKPFGLHLAFFATGFLLHIISELIGVNQNLFEKI
jgi:uncharacterized membrane protein